jgi:toxin HigB-1
LRRLFEDGEARGGPAALAPKLTRMLTALDAASKVEEMGVYPGWRLHSLKGDLRGFWSLTVTGNWRLIFRFDHDAVTDTDLVDYH